MKDCYKCGYSCEHFASVARNNTKIIDKCPYLTELEKKYISIALRAKEILPNVPVIQSTIKTKTGLLMGKEDSPIIVTANYPYTQVVLGEVMAKAGINCNVLIIDTDGYSVDMAVYLKIFNGERVRSAIEGCRELDLVKNKVLVIPGLAKEFKEDIEDKTGWKVVVGPICAAELPIFLLKSKLIKPI